MKGCTLKALFLASGIFFVPSAFAIDKEISEPVVAEKINEQNIQNESSQAGCMACHQSQTTQADEHLKKTD